MYIRSRRWEVLKEKELTRGSRRCSVSQATHERSSVTSCPPSSILSPCSLYVLSLSFFSFLYFAFCLSPLSLQCPFLSDARAVASRTSSDRKIHLHLLQLPSPLPTPDLMAPREPQSAPLADFFWIAGVDATELLEQFVKLGEDYRAAHPASIPSPVTDTIQEDADAEACVDHINESLARLSSTSSNCNSAVRLSRSENPRDSIHTITVGETESNRSSITVKGPNENRETQNSSYNGFLSEADFDKALFKFAAERESFLADLTLSTTTPPTAKPKPKPKTQRIIAEDVNQNNNNMLRSGIGSVRRHMSFRDMNSMKRQPSVVRHCTALLPSPLVASFRF